MAKLSPTQQIFIKELFGAAMGDLSLAADKAIGTADYSSLMTDELLAEIRKRADAEILMQAPKAVYTISKILANPEGSFYIDKLAKICGDVLDRAGISKKEQSSGSQMQIGIVFLPAKQQLPEPPALESIAAIQEPRLLQKPVEIK